MASIGDVALSILRSQNAKIGVMVGQALTNFGRMSSFNMTKSHPKNRINHGTSRTYGFGSPDIEISFTLHGTSDAAEKLNVYATQDVRNVLPPQTWKITVTSDENVTKTFTIKGILHGFTMSKREDAAEQPISMNCTIQVTDENVTIA